jgi:hypothetical protein
MDEIGHNISDIRLGYNTKGERQCVCGLETELVSKSVAIYVFVRGCIVPVEIELGGNVIGPARKEGRILSPHDCTKPACSEPTSTLPRMAANLLIISYSVMTMNDETSPLVTWHPQSRSSG